jgi:superfamily II DNA or RNA helicase
MIALRPYQKIDIENLRAQFLQGASRVCYAAPTGSGKTVVFVYLAHPIVENSQRVAIVVHRGELVEQTCAVLAAEGLDYGVIAAGYSENPNAPIQVCMAQTLVNRLNRLADVNFLIVDEAHHVMAATWRAILAAVPKARVLGVTATPSGWTAPA